METPRVKIGLGYTMNLGNFESLRVDISVEDSQRQADANVSETIERVYKLVDKKLVEKVEEAEAALNKKE